jgi:hypothetical protein
MANQQPGSMQTRVRAQFDRQAAHYLRGSAMADEELLERIQRAVVPVVRPDRSMPTAINLRPGTAGR